MPLPWLQLIDAALGVANFARGRRAPAAVDEPLQLEPGGRALGGLEHRLAGVVVVALKEAFDRDTRRLELEREQLAAERERAERALRLELERQAVDREVGRLRLLAGIAFASWIGTLFFSARVAGGSVGARAALGGGWLLLLFAIAASFSAQSRVAAALLMLGSRLGSGSDEAGDRGGAISSGVAGVLALWLIVGGLALVGVAMLIR
jgi:hypothetical protein